MYAYMHMAICLRYFLDHLHSVNEEDFAERLRKKKANSVNRCH